MPARHCRSWLGRRLHRTKPICAKPTRTRRSISPPAAASGGLMAPTVWENAMAEHQIRFVDGAAYERMMGVWSRIAGDIFLDWLAPAAGLRWLDVGCGSGAFTELLSQRCAPSALDGVDPAEAQLAFARTRPGVSTARFRQGDAMTLPFADDSFDAVTMALVIFFVPDPAKGVAEMARVVARG